MSARSTAAKTSTLLPDFFFHGISFLVPGLNRVAQECDLSLGEWLILWDLQHRGTGDKTKQRIMLRQTLTESLVSRGMGEANITRLLNSLVDKGHIQRLTISQEERDRLFGPHERENRLVVVLQPSGEKKIQEFCERLTSHLARWKPDQLDEETQETLPPSVKTALRLAELYLKKASKTQY